MTTLKLQKPDPKVRLSLSIPSSLNDLLKAYADFHTSLTQEEATPQAIGEAILRAHLESDKAFQKYLQASRKPAKAAAAPSPAAPFSHVS